MRAVEGQVYNTLVVDHYGVDHIWQDTMRPAYRQLMVIDDIADRTHHCDLLLDQNLVANQDTRYAGKVPTDCRTLLGPKFALLQPQYGEQRAFAKPRLGRPTSVLVYFGGADLANLTGQVVRSLVRYSDVASHVVISRNSAHFEGIYEIAQAHDHIELHSDLPSLAPLMVVCDLGIGAGGTTSWERCCLGLPSLVVTLAANQDPLTAELHRQGYVRWLGPHDGVTQDQLIAAIHTVLTEPLDPPWSRKCMQLVDGKGAMRVAKILMERASAVRA